MRYVTIYGFRASYQFPERGQAVCLYQRKAAIRDGNVHQIFSRRKGPKQPKESLWAVRGVSFDVLPGQCFGIVGRNGSGKSTILKLMARILRPNNGRIVINGRVSALLELGAGFHPDLTGRENIFLNAALLGFDEASTRAYYDRIVEFSELEEFIDMPVKHYSSGMYMRLGFSVAIHMQPDILIVDEILAVGDQAFQTKCINAIMAMKDQGVTIIIVSHNINLVRTLCTHILWIDKGIPKRMDRWMRLLQNMWRMHTNSSRVSLFQRPLHAQAPGKSRLPAPAF
ncbi:MAG: ABC transporter ATP-binding protein [Anaerolineaceae bacterium]|nr:ABC transporter ATP-binding protein [Anaerolineaceae bacterium]